MPLIVEKITAANQEEATSFLLRYEDTAVFLLGNLAEHGPRLCSHVNSGNFKLIRQNDKVVSVFCLTRRGNLLIQSSLTHSIFEYVIASCKEEPNVIRGGIGEWDVAKEFWLYLKNHEIIKKDNFHSKQINYALNLDNLPSHASKDVRFLEASDYPTWKALRINYMFEQELPNDLSDEEMYDQFVGKCERLMIWGLFVDCQPVSVAELNAKTNSIATVGGVYTSPKFRRKGLAKTLMKGLIFDCQTKLCLHKLIIITGENENEPAQKLYESLGCYRAGYMALGE
ncbi:MAG: GNAT family N-acetyltransferase [Chlamydiales bacterium]|nr:GNAT family N-acetyltransferase [Chlamydiales bacterium]